MTRTHRQVIGCGRWSQLESRALGKPKESVSVDTEESETERALRALTPEQRLELWRGRGLHAVADR
jgi:hypothetical protein